MCYYPIHEASIQDISGLGTKAAFADGWVGLDEKEGNRQTVWKCEEARYSNFLKGGKGTTNCVHKSFYPGYR